MPQKKPRKKMERFLSERSAELPQSVMSSLIELSAEHKDIVNLGPGEPDFNTPKHIIEFAKKKLDEGFTHYSPPGGRTDLKEAIAKKLKKENSIHVQDPENQIIVTAGSTEAIFLALTCLVDAGEEVLTPNPGFLAYAPSVELLDGFPRSIPLKEDDGFQINVDSFKKDVSSKTRAMIICTPSNPTGTVLKKKVLEELAGLAVEHDLMVLCDEAYEHFVYGKAKHVSFASLNGMQDYCITLQSFSKTYAMAGFRVGYAVGPEWIVKEMQHLHVYTSIAATTVSQLAALRALEGPQDSVESMRLEYDKRRKYLLKRLREIHGFHVAVEPEGAFYVFPSYKWKLSSFELSNYFIKNAKAMVVPGKEFGSLGEGFVRFSYATRIEKIEEGMNRIADAARKLK